MAVSCHNQLSAFGNACHNRSDYAAGRSVYQHICPLYSVEFCILLLSGSKNSLGLEQIVCTDNLGDVAVHHLFQKLSVPVFTVNRRAFVSRHMERNSLLVRMGG